MHKGVHHSFFDRALIGFDQALRTLHTRRESGAASFAGTSDGRE
jgi:hypothetical protein